MNAQWTINSAVALLLILSRAAVGQTTQPATSPTTEPANRVVVWQVVHETDYTRPNPESLVVTLNVLLDPALHVAYSSETATSVKAEDDQHQSLLFPGKPPADPFSGVVNTGSINALVRIALQPPPIGAKPSKVIAVLEGSFPVAVPTKIESVQLGVPDKVTRHYDGVEATFESKLIGPSTCRVETAFHLSGSDPVFQKWYKQIGTVHTTVTDATGLKWDWRGGSTTTSGAKIVSEARNYQPEDEAGPAAKVSIEYVLDTKTVIIPFRVENVPLP